MCHKNDHIKDKWGTKVSSEANRAWEKLNATLIERKKGETSLRQNEIRVLF